MTGQKMKLSNQSYTTAVHEFAHTISTADATKFGLTPENHKQFWKEAKKLHNKYLKETANDIDKWVSSYAHGSRDVSEFMAESFAQIKALENGKELPSGYKSDTTYSKPMVELIDKYFKK